MLWIVLWFVLNILDIPAFIWASNRGARSRWWPLSGFYMALCVLSKRFTPFL
jgi:hypothetical protein